MVGSLGGGLVAVGAIYMKVGVPAIVHEIDVPCQLDCARFTPVRASRASRVTGFARPVCPAQGISHEDPSEWSVTPPPVPDAFTERGSSVHLAAPAAAVLRGCVPWGGTRSEVVARQAGEIRGITAARQPSTGNLRMAAEMISYSLLQAGR